MIRDNILSIVIYTVASLKSGHKSYPAATLFVFQLACFTIFETEMYCSVPSFALILWSPKETRKETVLENIEELFFQNLCSASDLQLCAINIFEGHSFIIYSQSIFGGLQDTGS